MKSIATLMSVMAAGLALSSSAGACGNEVYRVTKKEIAEVNSAESNLNNRHFLWAGITIVKNVPGVRTHRIHPAQSSLLEPAVRVMALLTTRTGGQWVSRPQAKGPYQLSFENEEERLANLEWAVKSLRMEWAQSARLDPFAAHAPPPPSSPPEEAKEDVGPPQPSNPRDASNLGEALEALPHHRAEARQLLERLAADDLVTSAYAYAALARLRMDDDQKDLAQSALAQCRKMGGRHAAKVCHLKRPQSDVGKASERAASNG